MSRKPNLLCVVKEDWANYRAANAGYWEFECNIYKLPNQAVRGSVVGEIEVINFTYRTANKNYLDEVNQARKMSNRWVETAAE